MPRKETSRIPFTKTVLQSLATPAKDRVYYHDERQTGLALCVTAADTRTFYLYKWSQDRPIRIPLGKFPETTIEQARQRARKLIAEIEDGNDPQKARKAARDAPTVQDLFDHWIEHARAHKRTWRDDERQFTKYMAKLKNRRLTDLTTAEVAKWHRQVGKNHGPYQANRARALLSAMFNKSSREVGYDAPNPCECVTRFKEESRERFLQPDEMRPFFTALKDEPPLWRDFWLLALFTGARRGNVASMAWKDIDLNQGIWYLPGKVTKGGLPLAIVLPPPAVAVLKARDVENNGSDWVFPSDTVTGHIIDPRKSWARVLRRSGIEDLRPHDLRRSLGSWQAIAVASLQVIGASLGHKDPKATAVYSRLLVDPIRTSVNGAVQSMLEAGGETDNHDDS
jgi:integrase